MKALLIVAVPAIAAGIFFLSKPNSSLPSGRASGEAAPLPPQSDSLAEGFAVVELFTSEGCSSCPPAEKLLNALAADADASGRPVYALAFHVDYWNRLGWKDRFSDPAFSRRQQAYAQAMGLEGIYTPQMIVNGAVEFVGSDRNRAEKEIAAGLKGTAKTELTIEADPQESESLPVRYRLPARGLPTRKEGGGYLLNVALVEKDLETKVERGENSGKTLRHRNVVRSFRTIPLVPADSLISGRITLPLPPGAVPGNSEVIAYLQEAGSMKVLGVGKSLVR